MPLQTFAPRAAPMLPPSQQHERYAAATARSQRAAQPRTPSHGAARRPPARLFTL
jgi:hypothetical protein